MDKTEILVFRNGGYLRHYEKWYFDGSPVKIATYYNYLGVMFSNRLSWTVCTNTLVLKASKALLVIKQLQHTFTNIPVNVLFKLFDCKIKPILLYGAEVWGFQERNVIDKFHNNFCKYVLGVGKHVSSNAALAECGRNGIHVDYYLRCIKYWCKL